MFPCVIPGCAAMAETKGGECAAHRAGYRLHNDWRDLRCGQCRRLIASGQWYRRVGEAIHHVAPCKVHPEVVKELAKAQDAAAQ